MTIAVANVSFANTFGHWIARTNELAQAMSLNCVTVGGANAVGNAVVIGTFSVNTAAVSEVTAFGGANVTLKDSTFILANTANMITLGAMNVRGQLSVDSVATIKIAGSNATHQVLSAVDANGTIGFIKVAFPLDQLTDVDTSNIVTKDNETIIKWNANTSMWEANTMSLINSTRINTLNVGTISSILSVSANANFGNNTVFINTTNRRVGVGVTNPTAALHVNGSILATGDISGWQTSDETFKDNIVSFDTAKALETILSLDVCEYDWNEEAVKKSEYVSPTNVGHDVGLIAQRVQKTNPEWVYERPDGTLAINYPKIIPWLVAAVQHQNKT